MNKSKPKNGYFYVLVDNAYPDQIRMGYTGSLAKRIQHFNRNKPYKTAKYIYKSAELHDARDAYHKITLLLIEHPEYQFQRGLNTGWYAASNREAIKQAITEYFNK